MKEKLIDRRELNNKIYEKNTQKTMKLRQRSREGETTNILIRQTIYVGT